MDRTQCIYNLKYCSSDTIACEINYNEEYIRFLHRYLENITAYVLRTKAYKEIEELEQVIALEIQELILRG